MRGCKSSATGGNGATSGGIAHGFYNVIYSGITDCTATAKGGSGSSAAGGVGYGFTTCHGVKRCRSIGLGGAGSSTGNGYAFISCKVMEDNTAEGYNTGAYQSCFLGYSGNGAAPSNTARGDWNA